MVHLQGRACSPEQELRWLSTPSRVENSIICPPISSYLVGTENYQKTEHIKVLHLSEGISDYLSLVEIGADAVGCFGVEVRLTQHAELFKKCTHLVCLFDGDRYPIGSDLSGLYKSWTPMIRHLTHLKQLIPELNIWCCPPPSVSGIKDINDWLQAGLTRDRLAEYLGEHARPLEQFAISALGHDIQFHPLLLTLVGVNKKPEDLAALKQAMNQIEPDPVLYALQLFHE